MKIVTKYLIGSLLILSMFNAIGQQSIEPYKSAITFTATNLGLDVEGRLRNLSGDIQFDPQDLKGSFFSVSIPLKTINTGISMRDSHLQEEEFFDVSKHPNILFKSSGITKNGNGYIAVGMLTIKGISKAVSLSFTQENHTLISSFTIDRNDYNVGGDDFLDTIGDEIKIRIKCVIIQ